MFRTFAWVLAATVVLVAAGPVLASTSSPPLVADYWSEFVDYWRKAFRRQNSIVMTVLVVGAVALFIITRTNWRK